MARQLRILKSRSSSENLRGHGLNKVCLDELQKGKMGKMKEFSPGLLNIESCEENSMTCTECNAKFPDGFYCLKCGHVPPREAEVEDSQGELKQAA